MEVEPRRNHAIAAGLSSFETTHHQMLDVVRHPKKAQPTTQKLRAEDRPLENDFVSEQEFRRKLYTWFGDLSRELLPGRAFYLWGGYSNIGTYLPGPDRQRALLQPGHHLGQISSSSRPAGLHGARMVLLRAEKSGVHKYFGPTNATDEWAVKKINPQAIVRLTEKPGAGPGASSRRAFTLAMPHLVVDRVLSIASSPFGPYDRFPRFVNPSVKNGLPPRLLSRRNVMAQPTLPRLADLGNDLTETTIARRYVAVGIPLLCLVGYVYFARVGLWAPAVACVMAYSFFSYGSTSHDLVHGNLGFGARENAFWLSLVEMIGLRSGHAYRIAHLHHHARFPDPDDIEGEAAHLSFWRALAAGPLHGLRIHGRAFRSMRQFRMRIIAESALCSLLLVAAVMTTRWTYVPGIYVALVVGGSWTYPLVTAYFPHDPTGATVLQQTWRFRGPVARILFLDHLYHLEHHLYPRVPRHHWPQLARRLDPWLDGQGVKARRVGW